MKILVTGSKGQLGSDVIKLLRKRNIDNLGTDVIESDDPNYIKLDITDKESTIDLIASYAPDVIIHTAACTNVDLAEREEIKGRVYSINVTGTENIALGAKETGSKLIYLSTDYVFDGAGNKPWLEDSVSFNPLNYYGETKLLGENAIRKYLTKYFIVRISWVFGVNGKNFIKTILSLSNTHDTLQVVDDQIGNITYTVDLAELLLEMAYSDRYGTYHATNSGNYTSFADIAEKAISIAGKKSKILRVSTEEYGKTIAKRPKNSRLNKTKLKENGFSELPPWEGAIERYIEELKEWEHSL